MSKRTSLSPKRKSVDEPHVYETRLRKRSRSPKRGNTFDDMLQSLDDLMVLGPVPETEQTTDILDDYREARMLPERRTLVPLKSKKEGNESRPENLDSDHTINQEIKQTHEPITEQIIDDYEMMEMEKSREQLKLFMKEKHAADKRELAMVAENREKRALLERIKVTARQAPSPELLLLTQDLDQDNDVTHSN